MFVHGWQYTDSQYILRFSLVSTCGWTNGWKHSYLTTLGLADHPITILTEMITACQTGEKKQNNKTLTKTHVVLRIQSPFVDRVAIILLAKANNISWHQYMRQA